MASLLVNGERIEADRIREETTAVAKLIAEREPDQDPIALRMRAREWAEENLIEDALLRQAALTDPQIIDKVKAKVPPPRRTELMAFYRAQQATFLSPEMVRVSHIVCNIDEQHDEPSARAAIDRAQAALATGRSFSEIADELSDCPGRGGELGFFPRGQMVEAFENVVFHLAVGQVSEIFRTEFGFHIAQLQEKRSEGLMPFESVRERIEQHLLKEKHQTAIHEFVDGLRAKAEIRKTKDQVSP